MAIFKHLESEGDAVHIQSLLFDLLGTVNHALIHELELLAMSNEYFADLSLIYLFNLLRIEYFDCVILAYARINSGIKPFYSAYLP